MLEDLETKQHEYKKSESDLFRILNQPIHIIDATGIGLLTSTLQESARNTTESRERLEYWNNTNLKRNYNKVSGFVKEIKSLQELQKSDQAKFVAKSQ